MYAALKCESRVYELEENPIEVFWEEADECDDVDSIRVHQGDSIRLSLTIAEARTLRDGLDRLLAMTPDEVRARRDAFRAGLDRILAEARGTMSVTDTAKEEGR